MVRPLSNWPAAVSRIKKQFLDDIISSSARAAIRNLKRALLVLHAPLDDTVAVDNAADIFMAARHPKSFVSLDKADHLLSREQDAVYAGTVIAAWAAPYLGLAAGPPAARAADGRVAARTESGGFLTDMAVSDHLLTADEPAAVGGSNRGPTPYGLPSAALAACTSMMLQMYARHKGISLMPRSRACAMTISMRRTAMTAKRSRAASIASNACWRWRAIWMQRLASACSKLLTAARCIARCMPRCRSRPGWTRAETRHVTRSAPTPGMAGASLPVPTRPRAQRRVSPAQPVKISYKCTAGTGDRGPLQQPKPFRSIA